jgi:hypothetical protein
MGKRRVVYRVRLGNLRERDHLEDPGLYGGIILKFVCQMWDGDNDGIDLAQDRDSLRALVSTVMNCRVVP